MDYSTCLQCKGCKRDRPHLEFVSSRTPSGMALRCISCREAAGKANRKYMAKKKSKNPKKSSPSKPRTKPIPKKSSPVNYSSYGQESTSSSCTTISRAPRKPLCHQDMGTLLHEQDCMCAGPDKSISPNNFCLNNEFGRKITVLNNIDHIEKYAEGGSSKIANLQLLCPNCHAYKCFLERKSENGQSMTSEERQSLIFFTKPKEIYD